MRNVNTILTELSQGWENYTQVQKNAIASAVAGVRQYENFIVLMNNFGKAQDYAKTATESSGTALEKFEAYTQGVEAKINTFKSTFEEFAQNLLDSDLIGGLIDMGTTLIGIANKLKIVQIAFIALVGTGVIKGLTTLGTKLGKISESAQDFINLNKSMGTSFKGFNVSAQEAKANLVALALQTEITGINFANMSKQQVLSTIVNANAINAFEGLTKAEIEETLASMGVAEADKAETAAAIQNILAKQGQTISLKALTLATWLHIKAMAKQLWAMIAAHPVISALTVAFVALFAVLKALSGGNKKLAENVKKTSEAHEEAKSKVEEANNALEENKRRIEELQAQGSLTYVEQEELKNLKQATAELEWQLHLEKEKEKAAARKELRARREQYNKRDKRAVSSWDSSWSGGDEWRFNEKTLSSELGKYAGGGGADAVRTYIHFSKELETATGKQASTLRSALDNLTPLVQEYLEIYSGYISSLESMSEEDLLLEFGSDYEQEVQRIKKEYQDLMLALYPEKYKQIKWEEVLGLGEFEGATEKLQEWIDASLTEEEILKKLEKAYPDLIDRLKEFGIEEDEIIDQFKKQEEATAAATESLEAIKEEIEGLKDVYSTISDAIEEYNNQGHFTFETMQEILDLGVEYIGYLIDENGNIRKNTNALEDYLRLRLQEQAYDQALNYIKSFANKTDEDAIAIIQGKSLATKGLTQANLEFLASQIALLGVSPEVKKQIFQQSLAIIEHAGNVNFASDSTKDAKDATEDWEKVLDYANTILDEQIEKLEKEQEALKKLTEEKIKAHEAEIERLEKEKEALEEKNEEKNKEIELEKLKRNLQKAQQKTMRVFSAKKGTWEWVTDEGAVKEAQQELDNFYTEEKIENIDKQIEAEEKKIEELEENLDKEIESYEKRIEAIEKYKDKWNKVPDDYEKAQNAIAAKAKLGANAEKEILIGTDGKGGRLGVFEKFKKGYTKALRETATETGKKVGEINTSLGKIDFDKVYEKLNTNPWETLLNTLTQWASVLDKIGDITFSEFSNIFSNAKKTGSSFIESLAKWFPSDTNGYASGTKSAKSGLANVDEKGNELIIPKQGRYRMMEYGDIVVPHNLSQRIFDIATNPKQFVSNVLGSFKSPNLMNNSNTNIRSSSSTINIGTIELPSVNNGESFIKQLQLISANR